MKQSRNIIVLDVVIANAGIWNKGDLPDGTEINLGVNHFGHFAFIVRLCNALTQPISRIVIVSSCAHYFVDSHGILFDDISIKSSNHPYNGLMRHFYTYGQSKLANILFAKELSQKLDKNTTLVHAIHPGCVVSEIQNHTFPKICIPVLTLLTRCVLRSGKQGAQCTLHAAFSENDEVITQTGCYWDSCKSIKPAIKIEQSMQLWKASVDYTGVDLL